MSTPTPRTDAQINGAPCTQFAVMAGDSLRDALVSSGFARTLERELAREREKVRVLREVLSDCAENQQLSGYHLAHARGALAATDAAPPLV